MAGAILGSLITGGMNLIGGLLAARRNRIAQGQLDELQGQNTGLIDNFDQKYSDTFNKSIRRDTRGADLYADANGLNGPEGVARAQQAFQTGPGYQFQLDQGLQALNRSAAAGGMGASGNALLEAQRYGQGLANQEWGSYLSRLAPYNDAQRAGLENKVGLGSLITTARLENNAQRAEGIQSGINGRQTAIGSLLGGAATAFGNAAGYAGYNLKPTLPATGGTGFFQNVGK